MNIGLTGGIASGKSAVARLLAEKGAALIDADRIAREIVEPGQPALRQIVERFGQAVLLADGSLDRKKLGEIVFADAESRKALEAITHPLIRQTMWERRDRLERDNPRRLVVVDIPLLYESGLETYFEEVMLVYAPRAVQLERLKARDGLSDEQARRRLDAQMDIEEKRRRAQIVIDNSGDWALTVSQVERFWKDKGLA
jgi:dephospho-CoA kinase